MNDAKVLKNREEAIEEATKVLQRFFKSEDSFKFVISVSEDPRIGQINIGTESIIYRQKEEEKFILRRDISTWMCHGEDFVNNRVSHYGCGSTADAAIAQYKESGTNVQCKTEKSNS